MSKGYLSLRLEQPGERNYRVKIRVQDATNRFIRQRLAISLRQEVPFGQRCQSYICRRTRTPDSVGCIHFGNPTPMRLCLQKELLASSPISVSTATRFFTTPLPHQFNGTKRLTFLSPAISTEKIPLCPTMFALLMTPSALRVCALVEAAMPRGVGGLFGNLQ